MSGPILSDGFTDVPAGKIVCVVTNLEMLARPDMTVLPAPPGICLRHVADPEPDWYRGLFRRVGENWLWHDRLERDDVGLAQIIADPAVAVYAVEIEGVDQGLLELDFREADTCEIAYFGIAAPLSGQGIGRWLMSEAIDRAWAKPIRRFWVHTCTLDDPSAVRFYMRNGFVPFRMQIEMTDDPRLKGILSPDAAPFVPRV
ncbi:GNAT family N-acetyltransferase [Lichenihabitans sp. PAMC28606]|uniref:GNAT family N-acetyltransferase n=1 Tax=Lichenihabitans sp. PAMC28606 TaxID=2880932 RepID=UPI001D0B2A8D|nr:GNAT family N-acetyltransferase [Lichenihabitans sp. PAMC28606]UDL96332.1 GNAT family N-acetyltransferase [Lichenihabitans sp. PAMC28606]